MGRQAGGIVFGGKLVAAGVVTIFSMRGNGESYGRGGWRFFGAAGLDSLLPSPILNMLTNAFVDVS